MRVLFLTCHLPYPPVSGGRLREHELLRRVGRDCEVHVCAVSKTFAQDRAAAGALDGACSSISVFEARAGRAEVPAQLRRHACAEAARHVRGLAADVNVVHVEGFYLLQHVPEPCAAPVLLVEQTVEFSLWEQRVALGRRPDVFRDVDVTGRVPSVARTSTAPPSSCRRCASAAGSRSRCSRRSAEARRSSARASAPRASVTAP